MVMAIGRDLLLRRFPELAEAIETRVRNNNNFRSICAGYGEIIDAIGRAEAAGKDVDDGAFRDLVKLREDLEAELKALI